MIDFGSAEHLRYNSGYEEVRFTVFDENRRILCRVTREALEDNWSPANSNDDPLDIAKNQFDALTDKIGELIALGRFEDDGSILLRTIDGK